MSVRAKVAEAGAPTKLLSEAMARLGQLPEARQDEIALRLLDIAEGDHRIASGELFLTPDQWAEVDAALVEDGPYVPDEEMQAFFAQYRQ